MKMATRSLYRSVISFDIYLFDKKNMGVIELSKINFNNESLFLSFIFVIRHEQKHIPIKGGRQMWRVVENTLNCVKDIRCSLKVLLLELPLKLKGFSSRDTRYMGLIHGSRRSPRVGNGNLL